MNMPSDEFFLKQALKLAKKGISWTNPNPLVGAVIVKNNSIIGKGFHRKIGFPHAEIEALNSLKTAAKGATIYVNLEPCAHFGRTPPCIEAIIKSGIKKVVCTSLDPNPKVNGKGLANLQKAGIVTSSGILEKDARKLNETFFTFHERKRPFIAIKFAASLDGKMATSTEDSKWITNESAREYARTLRAKHQAVLVGVNTVITDNPNLGVREKNKKDPIRIILDPKLRIPLNSEVLRDQNIMIATTTKAEKIKKQHLENLGVKFLVFDSEHITIQQFLSALRKNGIISVLVEGGGKTLGNFVDSGIIDKVYIFHSPILLGGKEAVSIGGKGIEAVEKAIHLNNISYKKFDDNLLTIGYVN